MINHTEASATYTAFSERRKEGFAEIDELVDYLRSTDDTWAIIALIRLWPEITNKLLTTYSSSDATFPGDIKVAEEMLSFGTIKGDRFDVDHAHYKVGGWNYAWPGDGKSIRDAEIAYKRRLFYAVLALEAPNEFDTLYNEDVFALHGTKGIVLPSILAQQGLLSHHDQHERGITIGTGEVHPAAIRRQFISFASVSQNTDLIYANRDLRSTQNVEMFRRYGELYEGYRLRGMEIEAFNQSLAQHIEQGNTYLAAADHDRFGISIGLSQSALWMAGVDPHIGKRLSIESDMAEFGFAHQVGLSYLPVIVAPERHKDIIEELLESHDAKSIKVLKSEAIERARQNAMDYTWLAHTLWRERH